MTPMREQVTLTPTLGTGAHRPGEVMVSRAVLPSSPPPAAAEPPRLPNHWRPFHYVEIQTGLP